MTTWEKPKKAERHYKNCNFNFVIDGDVVKVNISDRFRGDYDLMRIGCSYIRNDNGNSVAKYCDRGFCSLDNPCVDGCVPDLSAIVEKSSRDKPKYVDVLDFYV